LESKLQHSSNDKGLPTNQERTSSALTEPAFGSEERKFY